MRIARKHGNCGEIKPKIALSLLAGAEMLVQNVLADVRVLSVLRLVPAFGLATLPDPN